MGKSDSKREMPYIIVNEFTEFGLEEFKKEFDTLLETNLPIIPVFIDSYGGEIYSLLGMIDVIDQSPKPVATVALGKAMSCGSVLLACGTPGLRFAAPNSTVMIHDAGSVSFGKIEDLKSDVGEAERLNNMIYEMLDTRCAQKPGYFKKLVADKKHTNVYLSAPDTLKHKVVDAIGVPSLSMMMNIEVSEQRKQHNVVAKRAPSAKKKVAKKVVKKAAKKETKKK